MLDKSEKQLDQIRALLHKAHTLAHKMCKAERKRYQYGEPVYAAVGSITDAVYSGISAVEVLDSLQQ